jgi:hypothetical protein
VSGIRPGLRDRPAADLGRRLALKTWQAALAAVVVVAVGAAAKLPEAILPIGTDTGMYATYARTILQGGRPYVDFYDVHPPLTYYYWVLVEALAGTDWSRTCVGSWGSLAPQPCIGLLAHSLDLALTCVAAWLVYAIARRLELRPFFGVIAAVLVAWFSNASMISMEGSTPTKLTLVPSSLAVYAYLRALPRAHLGWAGLAGAAGILAGLAKQPGLLTLVALIAYTLPAAVRGVPGARRVSAGMALGALVLLAPVLLYLALIGSLAGFVDQAWRYNAERFLIGYWQTPAGLASPATRIDRVATEAAGLLFVGALLGGLALAVAPSAPRQRLLLVWGAVSLVAIAGFREFAQVVPSLALLAAVGMGRLWDAAARDGLGLGRPVAGRLGLVVLFGALFMLSSSFQLIELRRAMFERGPSGKPSDPEQIATYLRQAAPPGPIFAWGNAGQIYALSGRQPATRFVIAEFTNTTSPRPANSRDQAISDLEANPPSVIVVDPHADEAGLQLSAFPSLAHVMQTCYERVSQLPPNWGVYVQAPVDADCVQRTIAAQTHL